jgi:hypothetical protein
MICEKCNNTFPATIIIENKRRNLSTRRFCLNCSPFGKHNTKKLEINISKSEKVCDVCNETKPINEFYSKNKLDTRTEKLCKPCSNKRTTADQRRRKQELINYKGGKCQTCGYCKYNGALDFHHIDPTKKEFAPSKLNNWSVERAKSELDKCVLLCSNCHREIHGKLIEE